MTLFYRATGPMDCPATLLLHGFLGSGEDWDPVIAQTKVTRRWIIPDLPGHRRSAYAPHESYSYAGVVDALCDILARERLSQVSVCGYSLGGRLALALALARPATVSHLTVMSASPGIEEEVERSLRRDEDARRRDSILTHGLERFISDWYELPLFESLRYSQGFDDVLARRALHLPESIAHAVANFSPGVCPSLWPHLSELDVPVHLFAGELDRKYLAIQSSMQERLRRARTTIVPGVGHALHIEAPRAAARAVDEIPADR
jgi:2-succinyl-6-hydroxy-2,4-cyclohexadiene-1-carboxylate synthase